MPFKKSAKIKKYFPFSLIFKKNNGFLKKSYVHIIPIEFLPKLQKFEGFRRNSILLSADLLH